MAIELALGINSIAAKRGADVWEQSTGRVRRSAKGAAQAQDQVNTGIDRFKSTAMSARSAAIAFGGALSLIALKEFATSIATTGNQLQLLESRLTILSGDEFAFDRAVESAQKLGVEMETIMTVFSRFSIAAGAIGLSSQQTLLLTENVTKLGQLGGASTTELNSGLIQLSQALASGTLRGDELRSVLEQLPLVAKVIAEDFGLKTPGALKTLAEDGKVTAKQVAAALLNATDDINEQFGEMAGEFGRATNRMKNSWTTFIAELDKSSGFSEGLSSVMNNFSLGLDVLTDRLLREPGERTLVQGLVVDIHTLKKEIDELDLQKALALEEGDKMARARAKFFDEQLGPKRQELVLLEERLKELRASAKDPAQISIPAPDRDPFLDGFGDFSSEIDDNAKALEKLRKEGVRIRDAVDPTAKYTAEIERLNKHLDHGTISQDTYNKAVERAQETLDRATEATRGWAAGAKEAFEEYSDSANNHFALAKNAAETSLKSMEDSLVGVVTGAKSASEAFRDFGQTVINELARIAIRKAVIAPFTQALDEFFTFNAHGNAFSAGRVIPMAQGGIVSSPTVFPMAQGMGLMGEAGPEAVMPLKRLPNGDLGVQAQSGGRGDIKIIINNETGVQADASVQERQGSDGSRELVVTLARELANQDIRRNGPLAQQIQASFGLARTGRTR